MLTRLSVVALLLSGCTPKILAHPPDLSAGFSGISVNGGRTHAVTVDPTNSNNVIIANQMGGLWRTTDQGETWAAVESLRAVHAMDVQYGADGQVVIATLARDLGAINGGGIWRSDDGGLTWKRPATGIIPKVANGPARSTAWAISRAPDDDTLWYVGTDAGVATSTDAGLTWTHSVVDATVLFNANSVPAGARSVLAMPSGVVLALLRDGVYRSDDQGQTWTKIRSDDYKAYASKGQNKLERSAFGNAAYVLRDYNQLQIYELDTGEWTDLVLPPGGGSRSPFVRVGRGPFEPLYEVLWVGQGYRTAMVAADSLEAIKNLDPDGWNLIGRNDGVHDDTGDLGVDSAGAPVMLGTDGGVFRPTSDWLTWKSGAKPGSGMNSLQISDLGGTNIQADDTADPVTLLYMTTQDNGVWASPDAGETWPRSDCCEGFFLEAPKLATSAETFQIAYGTVGSGNPNRFSDPFLLAPSNVPNIDAAGAPLSGLVQAFLVGEQSWIRGADFRTVSDVYVSDDDGMSWTARYELPFVRGGVFVPSRVHLPPANAVVYVPVQQGGTVLEGAPRIGLVRLDNLYDGTTTPIVEADILHLPDGGSLGRRATEFDWRAVFGVHPKNADFLIAPDIVHQVIRMSGDGGESWTVHPGLTAEVSRGGKLFLWDDHPARMGVTEIDYDPYNDERIVIGTRESGVVCSEDAGVTWGVIRGTHHMLYITGFHFDADGALFVGTYGKGLHRIPEERVSCTPSKFAGLPPPLETERNLGGFVPERLDDVLKEVSDTRPNRALDASIPYVRVIGSIPVDGYLFTEKGSRLRVNGRGFTPGAGAIVAKIDDVDIQRFPDVLDERGAFELEVLVPATAARGDHVLTIEQVGDNSRVRLDTNFVIAHGDGHLARPPAPSRYLPSNEGPPEGSKEARLPAKYKGVNPLKKQRPPGR